MILLYYVVPAGALNLEDLNNSCIDCHETLSPFTSEQSRLNEIRLNHTVKNISCSLECHEDVIRKMATDNFKQWSDSSHSKYYVTCDSCHGGNSKEITKEKAHATMKQVQDTGSPIYFQNIPETCGKCHAEELKDEILRARTKLAEAKAAGKDVKSAELDLDKAISVMEDIPSLWHGFNLKDFDNQVQGGIDWANKAEGKTSTVEPTVPSISAIGFVLVSGILALVYFLRKR